MHVYRNVSDQDLTVIGVGVVPAGAVIKTDRVIENPNLKEEGGERYAGVDAAPEKPKRGSTKKE